MPTDLKRLTVFISSPGDLEAERQVIASIVDEINPIMMDSHGILLKLLRWDRDLLPAVSTDAQAAINEQLAGQVDIYIGLLNARFGSPTPRAGSGTEEEFDHAYALHQRDPQRIKILFYLKTTVEDISTVDLDQLAKVRLFQEKLKKSGIFYGTFSDSDAFLRLVKSHLPKLIAEQWAGSGWKVASGNISNLRPDLSTIDPSVAIVKELATTESSAIQEEEEAGWLDILTEGTSSAGIGLQSMQNIGELTKTFGEDLEKATVEIIEAGEKQNIEKVKLIADEVGSNLSTLARNVTTETVIFHPNFLRYLENLRSLVTLHFKEGIGNRVDIEQMPPQLTSLHETMTSTRAQIDRFRQLISTSLPLTRRFRTGQRKAAEAIGEVSGSLTILLEKTIETRDFITENLSQPTSSTPN